MNIPVLFVLANALVISLNFIAILLIFKHFMFPTYGGSFNWAYYYSENSIYIYTLTFVFYFIELLVYTGKITFSYF